MPSQPLTVPLICRMKDTELSVASVSPPSTMKWYAPSILPVFAAMNALFASTVRKPFTALAGIGRPGLLFRMLVTSVCSTDHKIIRL